MISRDTVYREIARERGAVAEIYSAFGELPGVVKAHFDLNKAVVLDDHLPLSRLEREWLALETSRFNRCRYALEHHKAAYRNQMRKRRKGDPFTGPRRRMLTKFAATLTKDARKTPALKKAFLKAGFNEAQWLHAIKTVAYFNFTNRLALALDLKLEPDFTITCR